MTSNTDPRVSSEHLSRIALVYVRQSSPEQVRRNSESTRVQLGLCEKAVAFGWRSPRIIQDDLGISAAGYVDRPGFQELLTRVAMREVGIIFCLDASRLSRNSKDWAHLFELCGYFNTLIADLEQIYDISQPNDKLLMGRAIPYVANQRGGLSGKQPFRRGDSTIPPTDEQFDELHLQ